MDELWLGCAQSPAEAAQCDAHPDIDRDPPHVPRPALAPAAVPLPHRGEERGIYTELRTCSRLQTLLNSSFFARTPYPDIQDIIIVSGQFSFAFQCCRYLISVQNCPLR